MITCKEDLVNTYIENDNGVLRDVYVSLCRLHGICVKVLIDNGKLRDTSKAIGVVRNDSLWQSLSEETMSCSKKLTLTDLLPTSYENTKVYSLDEDVIRKYAELCGKKYGPSCIFHIDHPATPIGVINDNSSVVCQFAEGVKVEFTTLTTEQILAAWDLKFKKMTEEQWEHSMDERSRRDLNEAYKLSKEAPDVFISSLKDTQAAGMVIGDPKPDLNDLCEKYFWIIDDCKNNPEYRLSVKLQLSEFSRELESLKQDKQPKKTVKYVKCEFEYEWEAIKAFECTDTHFYTKNSEGGYIFVDSTSMVLSNKDNLYRRTEVEIDWREEVLEIKGVNKLAVANNKYAFVVDESSAVEFAHLVASLTPKP